MRPHAAVGTGVDGSVRPPKPAHHVHVSRSPRDVGDDDKQRADRVSCGFQLFGWRISGAAASWMSTKAR